MSKFKLEISDFDIIIHKPVLPPVYPDKKR
jgi:hypothetical protein